MSLENIPVKNSIEIETVKLDENLLTELKELNQLIANTLTGLGEVHVRKNDLTDEFAKLDTLKSELEQEFKETNNSLKKKIDKLQEKYPGGRINLQDGTIQYQPDAKQK
jgi:CRISPR/Cas system CMR-associated protein Cmr1 (group 7 of RAMP superfamily)